LTAWCFGTLRLHRVELCHSTANVASCRVALCAGFAAEGTKRGEGRHADGWHDMHLHARIDNDVISKPLNDLLAVRVCAGEALEARGCPGDA
jgi:RimJ/RimL family protein N-acetyltransferase